MQAIPRPEPGEYAPYTTEYFDLVPGGDVVAHMRRCVETTPAFFRDIPDDRSLESLIDEYVTVRRATLSFFESLSDEALTRVGVANGNPMSVRAAAFHIAGHELHHLDSIRTNYMAEVD